jgi:hypothetical protein
MKPLFSNLWKGRTSVAGLFLIVFTSLLIYDGKVEVMYSGVILYAIALPLFIFSDKQVKEFLSKALNAALKFFTKSAPILALLFFVSCGVVKHVDRNKEKTKTEKDSVASSTTKTEAEVKTVTEITADTSATAKGSTVKGSTPVKYLDEKPYVLEDENQKITVSKDSAGKLQVTGVVKDRTVNLKFKKKIVETAKTSVEANTKVKTHAATETKSKTSDKDVKRYGLPWWLWLLILLAVLAGSVFYAIRKGWLPNIDR